MISISLFTIDTLKRFLCPFGSLMWSMQHCSATPWNVSWKGWWLFCLVLPSQSRSVPKKHQMYWAERFIIFFFQMTVGKEMSQLNRYTLKLLSIVSITASKVKKLLGNCWLMVKWHKKRETREKLPTSLLSCDLETTEVRKPKMMGCKPKKLPKTTSQCLGTWFSAVS